MGRKAKNKKEIPAVKDREELDNQSEKVLYGKGLIRKKKSNISR